MSDMVLERKCLCNLLRLVLTLRILSVRPAEVSRLIVYFGPALSHRKVWLNVWFCTALEQGYRHHLLRLLGTYETFLPVSS